MEPTIGRIVHFVLYEGPYAGQMRPAMVTQIFGPNCVNLVVFKGQADDGGGEHHSASFIATSVNEDVGELVDGVTKYRGYSWHWPERK